MHGAGSKEKDPQEKARLSEKTDEYLRLSILTLQHCVNASHPPANTVDELHNSCFYSELLKELESCLL